MYATIPNEGLSRHNKIYALRYDVQFPNDLVAGDDSNTVFRRFQSDFIKKESRAGFDPSYVAVREQKGDAPPHYHGLLICNGNKTQSIVKHIDNANIVMNDMLGRGINDKSRSGYINECTKDARGNPQRNGTIIRRNDLTALNEVFRQGSYLAKNVQKDTPSSIRELFTSKKKS